ncbi:ATP-binding protein [Streptomyces sp. NPDC058001]|uniref:ATP-binding protein n=1 Tax=Streptomyces sp. NPDC058001 TaxID=3346300 RepID=UPI0036E3F2C1
MDRAVPVCRHLARLWLVHQRLTDENLRHTVLLITTELATNAIVHTGSTIITANLQKNRKYLQVQVNDEGNKPTGHDHWHNTSEYGRGLALIITSTQALGTRVERDGTRTTWATVPLT